MSEPSNTEYQSREAELLGVKQGIRDHQPTVSVLRLISGLAIVGVSIPGLIILLYSIGSLRENGIYPLLIGLGLVIQGLVIYAFFSALALIVEDLFAIRNQILLRSQKSSE